MKKILVLSDSHGNVNNMIYAVRKEEPDQVIHLGDGWGDAQRLKREFPEIGLEQVPGNCDFQPEKTVRLIEIEGFSLMLCHGHTFNVKMGLLQLYYAAEERKADVALFGHTHKVYYDKHNNISYMNPGSIGAPGFGVSPSYGILLLDRGTGTVDINVTYIEAAYQ